MACPSCGSWAVKADRALAGRMVCARCGHPLGLASAGGAPRRGRRPWGLSLPRRWRLWFTLAGLVGISAVLAAQDPAPEPRGIPQGGRDSPWERGWSPRSGGLGM